MEWKEPTLVYKDEECEIWEEGPYMTYQDGVELFAKEHGLSYEEAEAVFEVRSRTM